MEKEKEYFMKTQGIENIDEKQKITIEENKKKIII